MSHSLTFLHSLAFVSINVPFTHYPVETTSHNYSSSVIIKALKGTLEYIDSPAYGFKNPVSYGALFKESFFASKIVQWSFLNKPLPTFYNGNK